MSQCASFPGPFDAVVIGAGGAIGAALADALERAPTSGRVLRFSRSAADPAARIDYEAPDTLAAAASRAADLPNLRLVVIATGVLHAAGRGPEKALRDLDAPWLAAQFRTNVIGPALAIQAFAPLLPRQGKAAIAALSARVGSIGDNRLGGWHGYRASKAALNQIIRTAAIEIAVRRKEALCVGLHPGTVRSALSAPFLEGYAANPVFSPAESAARLLETLDRATPQDTGSCLAWDGSVIPP